MAMWWCVFVPSAMAVCTWRGISGATVDLTSLFSTDLKLISSSKEIFINPCQPITTAPSCTGSPKEVCECNLTEAGGATACRNVGPLQRWDVYQRNIDNGLTLYYSGFQVNFICSGGQPTKTSTSSTLESFTINIMSPNACAVSSTSKSGGSKASETETAVAIIVSLAVGLLVVGAVYCFLQRRMSRLRAVYAGIARAAEVPAANSSISVDQATSDEAVVVVGGSSASKRPAGLLHTWGPSAETSPGSKEESEHHLASTTAAIKQAAEPVTIEIELVASKEMCQMEPAKFQALWATLSQSEGTIVYEFNLRGQAAAAEAEEDYKEHLQSIESKLEASCVYVLASGVVDVQARIYLFAQLSHSSSSSGQALSFAKQREFEDNQNVLIEVVFNCRDNSGTATLKTKSGAKVAQHVRQTIERCFMSLSE